MAMIKCPECGKEISDKAESCPNCGCPAPIEEITRAEKEESNKIIKDIYDKVAGKSPIWSVDKRTIMAIQDKMNIDKKTAQKMLNDYRCELSAKYYEEHPEKESTQEFMDDFNRRQAESKIPKCPRCKSTSITYDTKKLSVGRGVVGGLVAGTPGMIMGGLSSKKGYAVCLNCGKRWKI